MSKKFGFRDVFILVFLHVETRRVFISPATYKPGQAWMIEQAEAFSQYNKVEDLPCKILMLDNDGKYSQPFLDDLKTSSIKTKRTVIRSPNMVAHVKRFIQSVGQECLDNELIEKPPAKECSRSIEETDNNRLSDICCHERLAGLLKSYSRKAAWHKSS